MKKGINTLLHVGILGFLVMVALLKWTLLPPSSKSIQPSFSPLFDQTPSEKVRLPVHKHLKAAELPLELKTTINGESVKKISLIPPAPVSSAEVKFFDGRGITSPEISTPSLTSLEVDSLTIGYSKQGAYWHWLKPFLIGAEVIPFLFFMWNLLRTYQIQCQQRDWVMNLMGAHPSTIRRLLHYRAILLALAASCIGVFGFTGLAMLWRDIPFLSVSVSGSIIIGIPIMGLLLSILASSFPPPMNSNPML